MDSEQKGKRNNQQNKDLLKSVVVKNYSVPVWGLGAGLRRDERPTA